MAPHFFSPSACTTASCENIKLIADSHGDFAHPFQSLGSNCGSVSAPIPSTLSNRAAGGHCVLLPPEMLYAREEGSLSEPGGGCVAIGGLSEWIQ